MLQGLFLDTNIQMEGQIKWQNNCTAFFSKFDIGVHKVT